MARAPERNWILTEEAAALLGVTSGRMRQILSPESQKILLPHSVLVRNIWLHYVGDVMKLKAAREKDPPRAMSTKGRRPKKNKLDASKDAQNETTSGAGNVPERGEN